MAAASVDAGRIMAQAQIFAPPAARATHHRTGVGTTGQRNANSLVLVVTVVTVVCVPEKRNRAMATCVSHSVWDHKKIRYTAVCTVLPPSNQTLISNARAGRGTHAKTAS